MQVINMADKRYQYDNKKIFNSLQQFEKPDEKQNLLQKRHHQSTRIATESTLDTIFIILDAVKLKEITIDLLPGILYIYYSEVKINKEKYLGFLLIIYTSEENSQYW